VRPLLASLLLGCLANTAEVEEPVARPSPMVLAAAGPLRFEPANITVTVGTSVTWLIDSGVHTVKDEGGSFESGGPLGPGDTFAHRFLEPGLYYYQCAPHQWAGMLGTITVVPVEG
jgi:plastocyanin